jgi:hypothetical protein
MRKSVRRDQGRHRRVDVDRRRPIEIEIELFLVLVLVFQHTAARRGDDRKCDERRHPGNAHKPQ